VSRNGATLAAARWRGFTREQANLLSRTVALPVIVGAAVLKAARLRSRGTSPSLRRAIAAGTAAAFASTLAAQHLLPPGTADRPLSPYAVYRAALAALVLQRYARRGRSSAEEPGRVGPAPAS
jgi:undecaprenyl-diphosphatase